MKRVFLLFASLVLFSSALSAQLLCGSAAGCRWQTVYSAPSAATSGNTSIPSSTMVTPSGDTNYVLTVYIAQTVATAGCTEKPTLQPKVIYTDADSGVSTTFKVPMWSHLAIAWQAPLNLEAVAAGTGAGSVSFRAKGGTTVSYLVAAVGGSGCTNQGTYVARPVLVQQ